MHLKEVLCIYSRLHAAEGFKLHLPLVSCSRVNTVQRYRIGSFEPRPRFYIEGRHVPTHVQQCTPAAFRSVILFLTCYSAMRFKSSKPDRRPPRAPHVQRCGPGWLHYCHSVHPCEPAGPLLCGSGTAGQLHRAQHHHRSPDHRGGEAPEGLGVLGYSRGSTA